MICERYWREGIVLVERGEPDPHRDGCADCTRAHASRAELVAALPLTGTSYTGDPHWQVNVWRRIERDRAASRTPWWRRRPLAGALAIVSIVGLWFGLHSRQPDVRPRDEIVDGEVAMRSASAHVGARWCVTVGKRAEVWIYRADRLVLRCRAGQASDGCVPDAGGMIAELRFDRADDYLAIVVDAPPIEPSGELDRDRGALLNAHLASKEFAASVH